ncbi:Viral late protein transcription factor 3, zinc ribbon [Spatholobus suberectus]|nr:Viral late protein transcription factor 3, zinc ribbon [Spatholobus suberectus]
MEVAAASSLSMLSLASVKTRSRVAQNCHVTLRKGCNLCVKNARRRTRVGAVNVDDVTTVLDPASVEVTWQIVIGAIAGVTPFVVAGIEFSKRIIAQKRCEVCGGSGLVLREKDYFRCPECAIPLQQCNCNTTADWSHSCNFRFKPSNILKAGFFLGSPGKDSFPVVPGSRILIELTPIFSNLHMDRM